MNYNVARTERLSGDFQFFFCKDRKLGRYLSLTESEMENLKKLWFLPLLGIVFLLLTEMVVMQFLARAHSPLSRLDPELVHLKVAEVSVGVLVQTVNHWTILGLGSFLLFLYLKIKAVEREIVELRTRQHLNCLRVPAQSGDLMEVSNHLKGDRAVERQYWPFEVHPVQELEPLHLEQIQFLIDATAKGFRAYSFMGGSFGAERDSDTWTEIIHRGGNRRWELVFSSERGLTSEGIFFEFGLAAQRALDWLETIRKGSRHNGPQSL